MTVEEFIPHNLNRSFGDYRFQAKDDQGVIRTLCIVDLCGPSGTLEGAKEEMPECMQWEVTKEHLGIEELAAT